MKTRTVAVCSGCDQIILGGGFAVEGEIGVLGPDGGVAAVKPVILAGGIKAAFCRRCFLSKLGIKEVVTRESPIQRGIMPDEKWVGAAAGATKLDIPEDGSGR